MPAREPSCEQRVRAICTEWGWHIAQGGDTALGLVAISVKCGRSVIANGCPARTTYDAWENVEQALRRVLRHTCRTETA